MSKHHNKHNKHNHSKSNGVSGHPSNHKRPTLTLYKRNELSALVACVLEIGFKQANNPNEEWQQYVDLQKLLTRVVELEAPLRRPSTNAPGDRLKNIENFYKWAKEGGLQVDGVEIYEFPGYELGLIATRDIKKDEQLFSIPRKLILSEEQLYAEFKQPQFGSMTNLKLTYDLMLEALNPKSFWKPYIDMLPEAYNTVLYFRVEQMEQLKGSNVFSSALRQCKAIARQYGFIYNVSQQQAPRADKITPLGQLFKEQFSYELYRWAVSTVMTRENLIPRLHPVPPNANGEPQSEMIAALIPFWDMANHKHGVVTSFYNAENHQMESSAQLEFKKGEQIFIHYGDRSNADLLVHNGFINPANPKDNVAIKLGLSASDALFEQRAKLLALLNIPKNSELKVLPAPEYISPQLLAFVRVFNMNSEQLQHWIDSERAQDLMHIDCALETSLDSKTWQYLQTRLMLLLRIFPSTLEADEEQLEKLKQGEMQMGQVEAMILEYRILEKRILSAALEYAKQRTKA